MDGGERGAVAERTPAGVLLGLLHTRRFVPLFVTQFLGAFNDNVYKNALVVLVTFGYAGVPPADSAMLVTAAAGLFIAPFFALSATAGQLADKFEKGRLIRAVKVAEILVMGLGVAGFAAGSLDTLLLVLCLMGAQSTFFGPLKYGILPQHLRETELTPANGLVQMATYLAILLGTITGGLLASLPHGVVLVSAAVVAIAVLGWLASLAIPLAPAPEPGLAVDPNIVRQIGRSIAEVRETPQAYVAALGISWFWLLGATFLQLLPGYVRDTLGGGPRTVTILLATFSLGIGGGAIACAGLLRGRADGRLVLPASLAMAFFAVVPMWLHGAYALDGVLACFLGLAVAGGLFVVPLYTLLQTRSDPLRRARAIGANNVLNAAFMVASALLTMALLRAGATPPQIFALVGVASIGAGVLLALRLR